MEVENKKNNIKFNILAIIAIIIFCFALSPITLQNDTYYTIKIGELILENGIDMQDHFSWHEDLPYTYPHWAYDTGIYLIYNLGEISGIPDGGMVFIYASTVILASILGILIYYTCSKITKNNILAFFITFGAMYLLKPYIAARAQLVTFILFVLTILFIEKFLESKKKRYLIGIVLVSIIIANVHVAVWPFFFILFLPYIAEYIICLIRDLHIISNTKIFYNKEKIFELNKKLLKAENKEEIQLKIEKIKKKIEEQEAELDEVKKITDKANKNPYKIKIERNNNIKYLILIMIICAFTGLLTPLGDTPYTYLVKTMEGNTTQSISEHLPLTLYNDKNTMIILAMLLSILIFTDTKIKLRDLFMITGLIFLSFMSRRQISLLVLIGCFIFGKLVNYLFNKYDPEGCKKLLKLMSTIVGRVITLAIVILLAFSIYKPKMNDKFVNEKSYPVQASEWILENLDVENIKLYNEYNYGSYLLFKGIPVFIDSRADLYAPEFNKTIDEEGNEKSRNIFTDYMNISSIGTYYEDKFEHYGITHAIVVKNAKLNMFLSRNDKYKELYKDDYFVIYERNVD